MQLNRLRVASNKGREVRGFDEPSRDRNRAATVWKRPARGRDVRRLDTRDRT